MSRSVEQMVRDYEELMEEHHRLCEDGAFAAPTDEHWVEVDVNWLDGVDANEVDRAAEEAWLVQAILESRAEKKTLVDQHHADLAKMDQMQAAYEELEARYEQLKVLNAGLEVYNEWLKNKVRDE